MSENETEVFEVHAEPEKKTISSTLIAVVSVVLLLTLGAIVGAEFEQRYTQEKNRVTVTTPDREWRVIYPSAPTPPSKEDEIRAKIEQENKALDRLREFSRIAAKKYFGDSQPRFTIELTDREGIYGAESFEESKILVHRDLMKGNMRQAKLTLLHEMTHWYMDVLGKMNDSGGSIFGGGKDVHGEPFQKEMQRLAKEGAFEGLW